MPINALQKFLENHFCNTLTEKCALFNKTKIGNKNLIAKKSEKK